MAWANQSTTRRGRKKSGKSRGLRRLLVILLVLAAIVALVVLALRIAQRVDVPLPGVPEPEPTEELTQPAHCPDVQLLSIPGTWESSANDDPFNPGANPNSLLLSVTQPLQQQFGTDRAEIYTLPYPAQFQRPGGPPEMTYDDSRRAGTDAARDVLAAKHDECWLTSYVLVGFSQGAVIAGDIASEIGNGNGPVPAENVLGVALVADGRRDPEAAPTVGPPVRGIGLEVSLAGFPFLPGATFSGKRSGGFGDLADKTVQICAPNDGICDAPVLTDLLGAIHRLFNDYIQNPVHAMYHTFAIDENGTTTPQWLTQWSTDLINEAPRPAHP
ncbi:cutinase family protein [Hoyosella altamirensis]|uniref:Cutinase n=1 Tax=Hoyosella altamirensis TaxID=616997 RepID=A0A839RQ12_9ACTN|nr:cutinase family protein [Hoyosella altamirensis]MBB3037971.1 hypothetical protein [Hoyosella altamirensis]